MTTNIGAIITEFVGLKERLKLAQDEVKKVEDDIDRVKLRYMEALGAVGLREGRNDTHSATVVEKVVPQVTDWDAFLAFIHANKFYHLLQRRPSTPGCAELFAQGQIPGVEKFKKVDVSLRSL